MPCLEEVEPKDFAPDFSHDENFNFEDQKISIKAFFEDEDYHKVVIESEILIEKWIHEKESPEDELLQIILTRVTKFNAY